MTTLSEFLDKIDKDRNFLKSQLQDFLSDIEKFCESNKTLIKSGDFPSISQLEQLRYFNDINGLIMFITDQVSKRTHESWSVRVHCNKDSTPFYRYLLEQILRYNDNIFEVQWFINYFIDSIKLIKNE